jgi:hypothetical protein
MQILRDQVAVLSAIDSWPDQALCQLLTERLTFYADYDDLDLSELFKLIFIEPGDTLADLDGEFNGAFLINHFSGCRLGDEGFRPCFETLEEHTTFYDMVFCEGDAGFCVEVIVPKTVGIDARLLSLCAQFATEAPGIST